MKRLIYLCLMIGFIISCSAPNTIENEKLGVQIQDINILKNKYISITELSTLKTVSKKVNSKGEVITGSEQDFSYVIPENSLETDSELEVTPLTHKDLAIGFEFKPEGQKFSTPTILTAKLKTKLPPKQILQVYSLNDKGDLKPAKLNDNSPIYALVQDDGLTVSFEIDHYSSYVIPDEIVDLAELSVDGTESFTRAYIDIAQEQGWMTGKEASKLLAPLNVVEFAAQAYILQNSFKKINEMNQFSNGAKTLMKSCHVIDSINSLGNSYYADIGDVCEGIFKLQDIVNRSKDEWFGFMNSMTIDVGVWAYLTVELVEPLSSNIDSLIDQTDIYKTNLTKGNKVASTIACADISCEKTFGTPGNKDLFAVPYGLYKIKIEQPSEIHKLMLDSPVVSQEAEVYITISPENGREHQTIKLKDYIIGGIKTKLGRELVPPGTAINDALDSLVEDVTSDLPKMIKIPVVPDGSITIDGKSGDWAKQNISVALTDPNGDSLLPIEKEIDAVDISKVYFAVDSKYLYYRIDTKSRPLNRSDYERLTDFDDPYSLSNARYSLKIQDSPEIRKLTMNIFPVHSPGKVRLREVPVEGENSQNVEDVKTSAGIIDEIVEVRIALDFLGDLNNKYLKPESEGHHEGESHDYDLTEIIRVVDYTRPKPTGASFPEIVIPPIEEEIIYNPVIDEPVFDIPSPEPEDDFDAPVTEPINNSDDLITDSPFEYVVFGSNSSTQGDGTWGPILKMDVSVTNKATGDVRFTVSKYGANASEDTPNGACPDNSYFAESGTLEVRVGSASGEEVGDSVHINGCTPTTKEKSKSIDINLPSELSGSWPKQFFMRLENSDGHAWVGPVWIDLRD